MGAIGKRYVRKGEHFPFPENYKIYYVQMGLLGTIVGFVIAFADVDPSAEKQSLILLEALGTALWSTLSALLLAYVLCPVLEQLYQRLAQADPSGDKSGCTVSLRQLQRQTIETSSSLKGLSSEVSALGDELSKARVEQRVMALEAEVAEQQKGLGRLIELGTALETAQQQLREQASQRAIEATELSSRQSLQQATLDELRTLQPQVEGQQRHVDEIDVIIRSNKEHIGRLQEQNDALKAIVGDLEREAEVTRKDRKRLSAMEGWLNALRPFRGSED